MAQRRQAEAVACEPAKRLCAGGSSLGRQVIKLIMEMVNNNIIGKLENSKTIKLLAVRA